MCTRPHGIQKQGNHDFAWGEQPAECVQPEVQVKEEAFSATRHPETGGLDWRYTMKE